MNWLAAGWSRIWFLLSLAWLALRLVPRKTTSEERCTTTVVSSWSLLPLLIRIECSVSLKYTRVFVFSMVALLWCYLLRLVLEGYLATSTPVIYSWNVETECMAVFFAYWSFFCGGWWCFLWLCRRRTWNWRGRRLILVMIIVGLITCPCNLLRM